PVEAQFPSLSPDGRFVAFQGENASDTAIYVLEIATGRSRMISAGRTGSFPVWSETGTEIFFWSDADMESVQVVSADDLEFTTPMTLFTRSAHRAEFHVNQDGTGFIQIVSDRGADVPTQLEIQVVLNWFDELERRVSGG
ncbi:MAG: TolB family protein, partial [Planctomycetota bacterium]